MYDPLSLFKLLLALWAFIREHLLKNKKIMKHFQNSSTELMLVVLHVVIIGMLANMWIGFVGVQATQRELENNLAESKALIEQQRKELLEKDRKFDDLHKEFTIKQDEVAFLRKILTGDQINSDPRGL